MVGTFCWGRKGGGLRLGAEGTALSVGREERGENGEIAGNRQLEIGGGVADEAHGAADAFEGGGFMFCPAADPCDGRLDLIAVSGVSRLRALLLLPLALKGAHTRAKGITIRTFERAVLTSDTALPVHTDGEPVFLQRRMEISLAPGRLRVIAPGS